MSLTPEKAFGVVYTDNWLVEHILDWAALPTWANTADIACGDGAFLAVQADRMCAAGRKEDLSDAELRRRLAALLHGFDIDAAALDACRHRLNAVAATHNISGVAWSLHLQDTTDPVWRAAHQGTFDAVVGNPPYVRVQNLTPAMRARVRALPECANGATDLYLAFFVVALDLVRSGGQVAYITPSSHLLSKAGRGWRQRLAREGLTKHLVLFGGRQMFSDASTYVAVTILEKDRGQKTDDFALSTWSDKGLESQGRLPHAALDQDVPNLTAPDTRARLAHLQNRGPQLKDLARVSVGLATLADKVFVLKLADGPAAPGCSLLLSPDGAPVEIENEVLRRIIKASTWKGPGDDQRLRLVFPYRLESGRARILPEDTLRSDFPKAYAYLSGQRARLDARDRGKPNPIAWYAFGRTQGLDSAFGAKILTAPMARAPQFFVQDDPDTCFYSGYGVLPHAPCALSTFAAALNTPDLEFFIRATSRDYAGGYKAYTKAYLAPYAPDPALLHDVVP